MKPSARHKARIYALQALYEWLLSGSDIAKLEIQFIEGNDFKRVDSEYFCSLLRGVAKTADQLDKEMQPYLDRSLQELTPIELTVLRIAIFELTDRCDVPYRVIINEALELTKKFGATDGFKYVNGVLDKVAKKLRKDEIAANV